MAKIASRRSMTAASVVALALGLAACGGSGGTTTTSSTQTVTASSTATVSASAPSASGTSSAPAAADRSGEQPIPDYQPSSVVSKSAYATTLTSPDPVSKIGSFYADVLAKDGWQITSKETSDYSASFTAHRSGEGATVSVYSRGSGAGISITTHKE